jgi:UDP-N-acetylmuramyl pentapeptide phosphotransferase/UDP-N-acetylglucosamine-1-phosphate transferase
MLLLMQYAVVTAILFAGIVAYFRIAGRYSIVDKPNRRSSHNYTTVRGGGIVFWLAGVIYFVFERLC